MIRRRVARLVLIAACATACAGAPRGDVATLELHALDGRAVALADLRGTRSAKVTITAGKPAKVGFKFK